MMGLFGKSYDLAAFLAASDILLLTDCLCDIVQRDNAAARSAGFSDLKEMKEVQGRNTILGKIKAGGKLSERELDLLQGTIRKEISFRRMMGQSITDLTDLNNLGFALSKIRK